ncbi:MAG: TetR/AcrR family transcriptional regulator [candidate division WOR-3 bacterium]
MKQKSDAKRRAILQAAFDVISEKGYYETKMEDVAHRAGVAKGTIYLYFRDKPDLYVGIVEWLLDQAVKVLREIAARPITARAQLEAVFDAWAGGVLSRPAIIALLSSENMQQATDLIPRFRRDILPRLLTMLREVGRIIKRGISRREFRRVNPELAALTFMNAFRAAMFAIGNRLRISDPCRAVKKIFFSGILAERRTKTGS